MLEYIRSKLRKWLLDEELDHCITCIVPGHGPKRFIVTGLKGLMLTAYPVDTGPSGVRLINQSEAVDQRQFLTLLRHYLGDTKLEWEDGVEYKP